MHERMIIQSPSAGFPNPKINRNVDPSPHAHRHHLLYTELFQEKWDSKNKEGFGYL